MRIESSLDLIRKKMRAKSISELYIENFAEQVRKVAQSMDTTVDMRSVESPQSDLLLEPPESVQDLNALEQAGLDLLTNVAVIKLNGGRSTTMGGNTPKGILTAKDGYSYLEIICNQIKFLREKTGRHIPLALMNSFFTHEPTLRLLSKIGFEATTFVQNQVPRLLADQFTPLDLGNHEDWAPPGHGDIYESLLDSGVLQRLLAQGIKWAFISNLDNLAASLDPWILGLIARDRIDFLLEVTPRTVEDSKGGTLVVKDGAIKLVEIAQVSDNDKPLFMNIQDFRVFNTNNVWIDLEKTNQLLLSNRLELPIIQNKKVIEGHTVVQLETAMGAAIGSFQRARGLIVGRDRFFPTKRVEDLFVLQSDACVLDSSFRLLRNPKRPSSLSNRPMVRFDKSFLDSPLEFFRRFEDPASVSLERAEYFHVSGNVYFERNVKIEGSVEVAPKDGMTFRVSAGSTLKDARYP
jgi:UTP--glucose-1-phosphate uridylyltransferase